MIKIKREQASKLLIVIGIVLLSYSFVPYLLQELKYQLLQLRHQKYVVSKDPNATGEAPSIFGQIMSNKEISIKPVNKDFALVIEKIGLTVPVVKGVSVTDESVYKDALKNGVAHAVTSKLPSENVGNVYIFAHSSFNFWALGKYATAFNLIGKLREGDEINVFYNDKRYIYAVVNKEILPGWNTYPLTRSVIEPILTLQTCDPPGTTLNRLIITAKLKQVL